QSFCCGRDNSNPICGYTNVRVYRNFCSELVSTQFMLSLSNVHRDVPTQGGRYQILKGISFEAQAGEVTALLGPNGAGKTTTLSIAQGVDKASSGSVKLLGVDPYRAGAGLRSQVGVMLQEGGLPMAVTG